MMQKSVNSRPNYVKIDGEILKLTHLDKILYPACGFTKADLIHYYLKIGPVLLPHLRNRAVTLLRYPAGAQAEGFYEKNCPSYRPGWIKTGEFDAVHYCLVNDLRTLIWVANLGTIEIHTTLGLIAQMRRPTAIVFDLDPGPGTGLQECALVALQLRTFLRKWNLSGFLKTSGKKGLHLYIPLNTPTTYASCTPFARFCAETLAHMFPDQVTSVMSKKNRSGKIFIDWSQNVDYKSTVSVYSLRANENPTVSTALLWPEVQAASKKISAATRLLNLSPSDLCHRVEKLGDLFSSVLVLQQKLPDRYIK